MLHEPVEIATYTRAEVRALDRWASQALGLPAIVLMENAAAAIEEVALQMLAERDPHAPAVVFCGPGNNGGDGLALARRLSNRGIGVRVVLSAPPEKYTGDAGVNLRVARAIGVPADAWPQGAPRADEAEGLVVDALLGTGMDRAAEGAIAEMIAAINAARARGAGVLAVDIPTGMDCDSGQPLGEHVVRADRTVTLAGLKTGFENEASRAYTGAVSVGDIGVPTPPRAAIGRAR